jgi:hypothetical protein
MDTGVGGMFRWRGSFCQNRRLMYTTMLMAHSWLRWVVLVAALVAVVRSIGGWNGQRPWTRVDDRSGFLFVTFLDLQLLIGLLLYFLFSPLLATIREQAGQAMGNDVMRYWLLEHPFGMIVALVLAHIGRVRIRKAVDTRRKHRLAVIFFGLALVAIAASIPWPGMVTARPLFRPW